MKSTRSPLFHGVARVWRRPSAVESLYLTMGGLLMVLLVGCNGDVVEPETKPFDRGALLAHLAKTQIVPGYAAYAGAIQDLLDELNVQSNAPEEAGFEALSARLKEACLAWQDVALFDFGPAMTYGILATTNTYPTDVAGIEAYLDGTDFQPGTAASLSRIGLPALDYLLNAEGSWARFSDEEGYAEHVVAQCAFASESAQSVASAWEDYAPVFEASTGTEMGSSMGELLNAFCRVYESNTRRQKLGLPCGAATFSATPLPDHVEAYFAGDWSVELLKRAVEAFDHLIRGGEGLGLDDYLQNLGAEHHGGDLASEIALQTEEVLEALDNLSSPLSSFVETDTDVCLEVYAELQALVVLWKVDMMSALGVLVTYQDNDGD